MAIHDPIAPTDPRVIEEIRREYRLQQQYLHQQELRIYWNRAPAKLDAEFLRSFCDYTNQKGSFEFDARTLCNKLSIVYETQQETLIYPGGAICKAWYKHHEMHPRVDFGYYFGKYFEMQSCVPTTLPELMDMHRNLCNATAEIIDQAVEDERIEKRTFSEDCSARNYKLLPLCRALLVVLDQHLPEPLAADFRTAEDPTIYSLDKLSHHQTLVLVRTGDEHLLSAPVDFSPLAHLTLPLSRPDASGISAVRVSIATAVPFLARLQRREEAAFPHLYANAVSDVFRKPGLPWRGDGRLTHWHPASEDEFLQEVVKTEKYDWGEGWENFWVRNAMRRVERRMAGPGDWDDLGEELWTRRWV
ncbi:hypothetical protein BDV95DRAFT_612308 [Massariosphaeria phaeospora]|uniref:Uncharacterized protein n=1 Tax=Massariosphaeria phaeospora TaxID=100035 RepID=A0A7C8MFB2_9PLEO|nr:hypothetical protein BDV95DRAFT_612308 [Massariosphaeria phaeospora]